MKLEKKHLHIAQRHHAYRLPHAQPDSRRDASVQPLDTVLPIDITQRLPNRQVLRPIRIDRLALHLHANHLNRLIPSAQPPSQARTRNLLQRTQPLALLFPRHPPDPRLRRATQPEARAPIRRLPNRDRVHAPVDAADALFAVNVHESRPRRGRLDARGGDLVLRDLDRLHAGAEAHGRVGLRHAAGHAAADAADEVAGAEGFGVVFRFRGDEEEDGAFGRGFDPGPGDEALVIWRFGRRG